MPAPYSMEGAERSSDHSSKEDGLIFRHNGGGISYNSYSRALDALRRLDVSRATAENRHETKDVTDRVEEDREKDQPVKRA